MDVHIRTIVGNVRAIDDESLLTPQTLERIVAAVIDAVEQKQLRDKRARSDTRVTAGVAAEQESAP